MPALPPAVAVVRVAVRDCLAAQLDGGRRRPVLVACSGGADSLALALAAAFVAPRVGLGRGLVTIDHGLQDGSAQRAAGVAGWATREGFTPVRAVAVDADCVAGGSGPEETARAARYAALASVAVETGAAAVLLGHTLDDQAETVLLSLARGGGPRGRSGMPQRRVIHGVVFLRPLLTVTRAQTAAACAAAGLTPWEDPHNSDPRYARSRVRAALPLLTEVLGQGVVANLARTAALLAADGEWLDAEADRVDVASPDGGVLVPALAALPSALRGRVLRRWALELGVPGSALSGVHLAALDALVLRWRGQGPVALPGGVRVARRADQLVAARDGVGVSGLVAETHLTQQSPGVPASPGVRHACDMSEATWHSAGIDRVILTEEQIKAKTDELAKQVAADHADAESLLLVGVLKGAVMFMADFARALGRYGPPIELEFMAVSSYGQGTTSSGVVRILKDLDRDIAGRNVIVVEDIVDSGLTLSWLLKYLESRSAASVEVVALLRKPDAVRVDVAVRYVGFDLPNEFVVGYGLDHAERYREMPFVAVLRPEAQVRP